MYFPMWHDEFNRVLNNEFKRLVQKNPSYSLRAFAKKLEVSPGAVSDLLRGKRKVSPAKLAAILNRVEMKEEDRQAIINEAKLGRHVGRILLPEQAAPIISEWHYFAILSVYESSRPAQNMTELSERLGLSLEKTTQSVNRLLDLGLLKKNDEGRLYATGVSWRTGDGSISSELVRASHQDGLTLAQKALHTIPASHRDFISLTLSSNKETLEKARKEIRKFKDRLAKIMSVEKTDSVFRLNINLFPIDSWDKWENKDQNHESN